MNIEMSLYQLKDENGGNAGLIESTIPISELKKIWKRVAQDEFLEDELEKIEKYNVVDDEPVEQLCVLVEEAGYEIERKWCADIEL